MSVNIPAPEQNSFFVSYRKGANDGSVDAPDPVETDAAPELDALADEWREDAAEAPVLAVSADIPDAAEVDEIPENPLDTDSSQAPVSDALDPAGAPEEAVAPDVMTEEAMQPLVDADAEPLPETSTMPAFEDEKAQQEAPLAIESDASEDLQSDAQNTDDLDAAPDGSLIDDPAQAPETEAYLPRILDKIDQLEFVVVEGREVTDFLLDKVALLSQGIDLMGPKPKAEMDAADDPREDPMAERLGAVETSIDAISNNVATLAQSLKNIDEKLDALAATPAEDGALAAGVSDLKEHAAQTDSTLAQIKEHLGTAASQVSVEKVQEAISGKLDAIETGLSKKFADAVTLENLSGIVAQAIPTPPTIDAQSLGLATRDVIEQSVTAIAKAHESAIEQIHLAHQTPSMTPVLEELGADIAQIKTQLQGQRDAALSAEDVAGQVSSRVLADVQASFEDHAQNISDAVGSIAARPDPVLDLTEQRRGFAQFAAVLAQIVERFECAADKFSTDDLGAIHAGLADLGARLQDQRCGQDAAFDALKQAIAEAANSKPAEDVTDRVAERLDELSANIRAVSQRPDPVLDLTAQHRGFAQFNAAAAVVLRRFEHAIERMGGDVATLSQTLAAKPSDDVKNPEAETAQSLAEALNALASANRTLSVAAAQADAPSNDLREIRLVLAEFIAQMMRHAELDTDQATHNLSDFS